MYRRLLFRLAAMLVCLGTMSAALPATAKDCEPLAQGSSRIEFSGWSGPKLPVFVHKPQTAGRDSRIVFVMHGVYRDGDRYRDEWRDLAEKHDLIIVVPTFGRQDFPTTASYNLGNIVGRKGRHNPRSRWSFAAIEPLFDEIVCRVAGNQRGYALYGHSAGGQFVHRYVAFADAPRLQAAVAANSGWYTMPNGAAFPYGWGGDAAGLVSPEKAFQRPLTILLGTEDKDRCCQSNANLSPANVVGARGGVASGRKVAPLGKRCRASFLVSFSVGEVTFLIDVVVERGVD